MDKRKIEHIYIIGLGALGSLYASKLHDTFPKAVKIIADKHRVANYKREGIIINNKPYNFDFITPDDKLQAADLIIIAVKYAQLNEAIESIKPFVGKKTVVMSLLNGISSEGIIANIIGEKHVLPSYGVGMDAVREGTAVHYTNPGRFVFGEKDNEKLSERVKAVKWLFEQADIPHFIPVDMERALWSKFMLNVGVNQVSAVLKAPYGFFPTGRVCTRTDADGSG